MSNLYLCKLVVLKLKVLNKFMLFTGIHVKIVHLFNKFCILLNDLCTDDYIDNFVFRSVVMTAMNGTTLSVLAVDMITSKIQTSSSAVAVDENRINFYSFLSRSCKIYGSCRECST